MQATQSAEKFQLVLHTPIPGNVDAEGWSRPGWAGQRCPTCTTDTEPGWRDATCIKCDQPLFGDKDVIVVGVDRMMGCSRVQSVPGIRIHEGC